MTTGVPGTLFFSWEAASMAVHEGHGEIQGNEVGAQRGGFFEGLDAVDSFATNFKVMEFEERANGAPDNDFVFNDENALGHRKLDRG